MYFPHESKSANGSTGIINPVLEVIKQKSTEKMQRLIFVVVFLLCLSCRCIKSFHSFRNRALLPYKYGDRSLFSVQTLAAFEKLPQWLIDSCHSMGYIEPTDVQKLALPVWIFIFY